MIRLLHISVETRAWTMGNHAWFDARLKPGATIEVHWGDGTHSVLHRKQGYEYDRVEHYYESAKRRVESFEIEFLSNTVDALEALIDGTWEMTICRVVFDNCPALRRLCYTHLSEVDFSGSPNLEVLEVEQFIAQLLDLSSLTRLHELNCSHSANLSTIVLSQNHRLTHLNIDWCPKLNCVIR